MPSRRRILMPRVTFPSATICLVGLAVGLTECHAFLPRIARASGWTTRPWGHSGAATDSVRLQLYEIPLLDVVSWDTSEARNANEMDFMQPLPSRHLPPELQTTHVYGMQLTAALHQSIVQHAMEQTRDQIFGHVAAYSVQSPPSPPTPHHHFIGAIGCTAKVLMNVPAPEGMLRFESLDGVVSTPHPGGSDTASTTTTVLCLGLDRFIVRDIVQTVPYVVALVEPLDDDRETDESVAALALDPTDAKDDGDDDYDAMDYATLTPTELMQRTLRAMEASIELLQSTPPVPERSLLEQSIVSSEYEDQMAAAARAAVEETVAVWHVFQQSLVDIFVTPHERYYAVAIMAAELCAVDNAVRRALLVETHTVRRLQRACAAAERTVAYTRASRRLATSMTDASDEASQDLLVGAPTVPPWVSSIRIGTRLEYYWNDEHGWCTGTVVRVPERIVEEWIVTVQFSDESTHRLPLTADDKARWRPL